MEIKIFDREGLSLTEKNSLEILDEKTKFYEELIVKAKENKNILCKTDFYSEGRTKHFLNLVSHKNKKDEVEENIKKISVKYLQDSYPVVYKRKCFSNQLLFVSLAKEEFKSFLKSFFVDKMVVKTNLENLEFLFGKIFVPSDYNSFNDILGEIKSKEFGGLERKKERFIKINKIYMKECLSKNTENSILGYIDNLTDFPRDISKYVMRIKYEEIPVFSMVDKEYIDLF